MIFAWTLFIISFLLAFFFWILTVVDLFMSFDKKSYFLWIFSIIFTLISAINADIIF